jgi:hypothetical protein
MLVPQAGIIKGMKRISKIVLIVTLFCVPVFAEESPAPERTVYIATSGKGTRYHFESCRTLRNSEKRELTISEAKRKGYTSCGVCHPGD